MGLRRSPLAEGARDLVVQRLEQILQRRALVGLDEGLDRHAGNEADVLETRHLRGRQRDADGVIGGAGCAEFCCCGSCARSADTRVITPMISGVVRWLPAMTFTIAVDPVAI